MTTFDTRYASSGLTGVVARCLAAVSYLGFERFFNHMYPATPVTVKWMTMLSSASTGAFVATQMGFPIEADQCFIQLISGTLPFWLSERVINLLQTS